MYKDELLNLFKDVPDAQKELAKDCIEEYCLLLDRIKELQKLPYIRVDAKNKSKQQLTPAAKLLKEYNQSIDNKRKILLMILYRSNSNEDDNNALVKLLAQFE